MYENCPTYPCTIIAIIIKVSHSTVSSQQYKTNATKTFVEELKNVVLVQGDSKNHNIVSSVTVDGSYHPTKESVKNR